LFPSGRSKGVAGGQHDTVTVREQPVRQLTDGRGLAGTVDSDHQNDVRPDVGIDGQRPFHGLQDLEHGVVQGLTQRIHVLELVARHAFAQLLENLAGCLRAHVGRDQARFELIEDFRVDLAAGQKFAEIGGEPGRTLVELGAQALEKPADFRGIGFVRHGRV
jgi:hypothetical protein